MEEKEQFSERIEVSDGELSSFVLAVKTRFGLDFSNYETKSLKRGLARLMMRYQFRTLLDLWSSVLRDKDLIVQYIDELLVNLTEFFRNPEVWCKLRDEVLDRFAPQSQIRIWNAGCSTGEEVFTTAIVLKERFLLHKTQQLATDLSQRALQKAIEGSYNSYVIKKMRQNYAEYNPNGDVQKYFFEEKEDWAVINQLKKNIKYQRHNLVQDPMLHSFDLIFCRNVMIYFDDTLKMKTLQLFHQCLNPEGLLIIGYYDMLPEEAKALFEPFCATTRIYKKRKV